MKSEELSEVDTRARVARGRARALCARTLYRHERARALNSGEDVSWPLPDIMVYAYTAMHVYSSTVHSVYAQYRSELLRRCQERYHVMS